MVWGLDWLGDKAGDAWNWVKDNPEVLAAVPAAGLIGGAGSLGSMAAMGALGSLAGGGKTSSNYGGGSNAFDASADWLTPVGYETQGLQEGNAANGISGVSLADPTRMERAADAGVSFAPTEQNAIWGSQVRPGLETQGPGQTFARNAMTQAPGAPSTANTQGAYDWFARNQPAGSASANTQGAYDWFARNQPNLSEDAGLGAYYDRAKERALADVNKNAASRGMFGSTVAMGQGADAVAGLEAERANREADYALQRAGELRSWGSAGSGAAGAADSAKLGEMGARTQFGSAMSGAAGTADSAKLGAAGENRNWFSDMGNLGLSADQQNQQRLGSLMSGAGTLDTARNDATRSWLSLLGSADTAGMNRGQAAYDMSMGLGNAVSGAAGDTYQQELAQDQALRDQFIQMALGGPASAYNNNENDRSRMRSDIQMALDIAGMAAGA